MNNVTLNITKEEVIIELKRVYFEYFEGSEMTFVKFNWFSKIDPNTIWEFFYSWENALKQAQVNFISKTRNLKQKKQKMIADLNKVKAINQGKYFDYYFYKKNSGEYDRNEILHLLNHINWQELINKELKLVKIKKPKKLIIKQSKYTKKELFNEVKRIWQKFGRRPSYIEFRENATIKINVYEKEFSTWTLCIEKFCIENNSYNSAEPGRNFRTTPKLLLQELESINIVKSIEDFTFKDYKLIGGKYSRDTFNTHFGNWQKAKELVGLKEN